jgi:serine protease Do
MKKICLFLVLSFTTTAFAASNKLWSEQSALTPPLAQVPDFRALAKQVVPAVVSVNVEQKVKLARRGPMGGGPGQDPFDYFNRFFGGEIPREYRNRGLGSGFVIRSDGLILTNYHVVENADSIEVIITAEDGSERKINAKVLGTAPDYDVALIKTDKPANAVAVNLGNSTDLQIGDWVMAVGNPFGLSHSVSVGIVSAKERREVAPSGRSGYYDFIQTDASINPGNSGGPLINMKGEVIGINTAINAQGSGIGFAIPINMVKSMLPELESKGKFTRSWLGIKIQRVDADLAQSYGLKKAAGALIAELVPKGPAALAGLKQEDIVLEFDGKPIRDSSDLPLYASMAGVGRTVNLKVWRAGKTMDAKVLLKGFPDEQGAEGAHELGSKEELGMLVTDITPQLAQRYQLETRKGVLLKDVDPDGLAARVGLRPGDVVLSVNDKLANSAREFSQTVRRAPSGTLLRLQVMRQDARLFVALKKP